MSKRDRILTVLAQLARLRRRRDALATDPAQLRDVTAQMAALYRELDTLFNRRR